MVLAKVLLTVGIALVLFRLSRIDEGWWLAATCTALALLAMSLRLFLQPATVSYLFLALTLWALRAPDRETEESRLRAWLPPWRLLALFVAWAHVDRWFMLGLAIVALVWLGRMLDVAKEKGAALLVSLSPRLLVSLSLLAAGGPLHP